MCKAFNVTVFLAIAVLGLSSCTDAADDALDGELGELGAGDETSTSPAEGELTRAAGLEVAGTRDDTGAVVAVDPAAVPKVQDCDPGYFCLWEAANFGGRKLQFRDLGCQNLTDSGFNDKASSWYNRTSANFRVYEDVNCDDWGWDDYFTARAGERSSYVGGHWNDRASSICVFC